MKNFKVILGAIALSTLVSCNIDQTKKGELPEVDVDIETEEGELPAFDVDWADVNVGTRTKMVEVPKVVVVMEEEEIEVPYIDVDMPEDYEDREKIERSLVVEAEVSGKEHEIDIKEIRADQTRLYVIATLEEGDADLGDKTMRVQDQIELNAPDLDVHYVIVGKKPARTFNNRYMYVNTMSDFNSKIKNAKVIYED